MRLGRMRRLGLAVAAALCVWVALVLAAPAAWADGYSMPRVSISAVVQEDGTLTVREERTFSFDDDVNGVYWTVPIATNEQGGRSRLTAVRSVSEKSGSGERAFAEVESAEKGQAGVYTVARVAEGTQLMLFAPHEDGDEAVLCVEYELSGAVMAWDDTAELYWQFVGPDWAEDSENVELAVTFAGAGSGEAATTGTDDANLRAWAHGPLDGTIAVGGSGNDAVVEAAAPLVQSGQYAEVRAVFPRSWVPGLTVPESAAGTERMPVVLDEERAWAEEANARRESARQTSLGLAVAQVALPAVFLAVVVVAKLKHPKPRPVFAETYFRDVPSADHPAVISAFMNGGTVDDKALVATLMKLTDEGVVELESERRERKRLFGSKVEEDYALTIARSARDAVTDAIDRAALKFFFVGVPWEQAHEDDVLVRDERSRSFDDLQAYAKRHRKRFGNALDDFKGTIEGRLETRNLVASDGSTARGASVTAGVILAICSFIALVFTDAALPNVVGFVVGLALTVPAVVLGFTFRRLTPEGAELDARCRALKKWLEEFTRLGEAVPGDLVLWNKLLVMAVALGVSDEVLRELADAVPADRRMNDAGMYYYPIYWWCYPHAHLGAPAASLHTAYAASISELAGSANSSAGGFGGGFSGGGGGGVGGGGGGTF